MSQPAVPNARNFETIAIVGVGLIGGSIGLALKSRSIARTVIGVGRDPARLQEAQRRGIIDERFLRLAEGARHADLVVFCTPVDRIVAGVREAAAACRTGTLITDAGSVKGSICRELAAGPAEGVEFVGSHPLAGSEKQGFEFADAKLFENRVCVVTPVSTTSRGALERVSLFWQSLGAALIEMSPEAHDRALGETSHLPHLVAAALAATLQADNRALAATGFRDTTRIASGDPELWSAILLANRDEVLASVARFGASLRHIQRALEQRDADSLIDLLRTARENRESLAPSAHGSRK